MNVMAKYIWHKILLLDNKIETITYPERGPVCGLSKYHHTLKVIFFDNDSIRRVHFYRIRNNIFEMVQGYYLLPLDTM